MSRLFSGKLQTLKITGTATKDIAATDGLKLITKSELTASSAQSTALKSDAPVLIILTGG
jgi:hypothetical protein